MDIKVTLTAAEVKVAVADYLRAKFTTHVIDSISPTNDIIVQLKDAPRPTITYNPWDR